MKERMHCETLKLLQRERTRRHFSGFAFSYEKECAIEKVVRDKLKTAKDANKILSLNKERKRGKSLGRKLSFEDWLNRKRLEEVYRKLAVETERKEQEQIQKERELETKETKEER